MPARLPLSLATLAALALAAPTAPAGAASSLGQPKAKRVVRAAGDVAPSVRRFKLLLGPDRGGVPRHYSSGRRELVWDAVPDEFAAPHALPGDFFNARVAPRARGAVLRTPGDHVAVSADADNPDRAPVRFGDINPAYAGEFEAFSPERLFSPIGSNVVNLTFRVPGTTRGRESGDSAPSTPMWTAAKNTAFRVLRRPRDARSASSWSRHPRRAALLPRRGLRYAKAKWRG